MISTLTPLTRSIAAVASSRSDSLTRNSCRPRMMVVPSAKRAATASTRYSSIIEGARSGGTSTPRSFEARTRNCAIGSPASPRTWLSSIEAPISRKRREQPGAQRIGHDVRQHDIGAFDDQRRHDRERRRGRIGRHHDLGAVQFGLAGERDLAAMAAFRRRDDLRAEMLQHQFGMVAAGLGLDHGGDAGRGQPRQQHRGFDLRRRHRRAVEDRQRIARAVQASAAGGRPRRWRPTRAPINSRGSSTRRIGRLRSEASPSKTAVIGQPATAPITSRQPVPELPKSSGTCRLREAGDADAVHRPGEIAGSFHLGAQRPHRLGGIEHVLALQQARNPGFADRQRAQNQGAVRNRLVAGNPDLPGQGAAGAGLQRGRVSGGAV